MSPIMHDVYLLILSRLNDEYLNLLLNRVPQKPKGVTMISEKSPKPLRKRVISCLQNKKNKDNILLFIEKGGLDDIVKSTKIDYEYLDMSNYRSYLEELKNNNNIPAVQGLLFFIARHGSLKIDDFFNNSKENFEEFNEQVCMHEEKSKNTTRDKQNEQEKIISKLKEELKNAEKKNENNEKNILNQKKIKLDLETQLNTLKQKHEVDIKNNIKRENIKNELTIINMNSNYEKISNEKDEIILVYQEKCSKQKVSLGNLEIENKKLKSELDILTKDYAAFKENLSKRKILLLGNVTGVDLKSFPDKYFDVINVENLSIHSFSEVYNNNRYDEVWLIEFQIPRRIKNELREKYPTVHFKNIEDNSAFY